MKNYLFTILCLLLLSQTAIAKDQITVETLAQGNTSWDGGPFKYPKNDPEITVSKITIPHGFKIPLHCHPVPLAAYIIKGKLEVIKESGQKKIFKQGDGLIEVMNTWHKGQSLAKITELVVFYAGSKQFPLTLKKGDTDKLTKKCN